MRPLDVRSGLEPTITNVVKDWASNQYFKIADDDTFLPKQLLNQAAFTGFISDFKGIKYYSTSGYQAVDSFIQDADGNWYYFGENGYMVTGAQEIKGKRYFFLANGRQLRDSIREDGNGNQYYYDTLGVQYISNYYSADGKNWRYFDENGVMARGLVTIDGKVKYFDQNGYQVKGKIVKAADGKLRYFEPDSGELAINTFAKDVATDYWYYFGADGIAVTGLQKIGGQTLYFDENGVQVKGQFITNADQSISYFDADSGAMAVNKFVGAPNNVWYYFGADGKALTGLQTIDKQTYYFKEDGVQVKGQIVVDQAGKRRYFDADSGVMVVNKFVGTPNNIWYYFGADGIAVVGSQRINNQDLYFNVDGVQVKGQLVTESGKIRYYDADSGVMAVNKFVEVKPDVWYYFGADGTAVVGSQTINNQHLYFNADGVQVKGQLVTESGKIHYYDKDSGGLAVNTFVELDNARYYFGTDGTAYTGAKKVNNQYLYFGTDGKQVKGKLVTIKGVRYYYDAETGEMVRNRWIRLENGMWMYFDRYGRGNSF